MIFWVKIWENVLKSTKNGKNLSSVIFFIQKWFSYHNIIVLVVSYNAVIFYELDYSIGMILGENL